MLDHVIKQSIRDQVLLQATYGQFSKRHASEEYRTLAKLGRREAVIASAEHSLKVGEIPEALQTLERHRISVPVLKALGQNKLANVYEFFQEALVRNEQQAQAETQREERQVYFQAALNATYERVQDQLEENPALARATALELLDSDAARNALSFEQIDYLDNVVDHAEDWMAQQVIYNPTVDVNKQLYSQFGDMLEGWFGAKVDIDISENLDDTQSYDSTDPITEEEADAVHTPWARDVLDELFSAGLYGSYRQSNAMSVLDKKLSLGKIVYRSELKATEEALYEEHLIDTGLIKQPGASVDSEEAWYA
jgi:hypothetical protein